MEAATHEARMAVPAFAVPGAMDALMALDKAVGEESDERIWAISGWRDAPYFDDAERAALALAEAVTRVADRDNSSASVNLWNRLNVATRQVAGKEW